MPPKMKKTVGGWVQCDECGANLMQKDTEEHGCDCPPDASKHLYDFIRNSVLFGSLDVKNNEDIKTVSQQDRDMMVFLSQSAIQLCGFAMGEYVEIKCNGLPTAIGRKVWPTSEKSITSVLFTKNGMENLGLKVGVHVSVAKIDSKREAIHVTLVMQNNKKVIDLSTELQTRLLRTYEQKLILPNNVLCIDFYGKVLKFIVKDIEYKLQPNLEDNLANLSISKGIFAEITENTKFKLYKDNTEYKNDHALRDTTISIGGLDNELSEIKELIQVGLGLSDSVIKFRRTKSCLLYGNPGTGKTLLANVLTRSIKAHVVNISSADLYTKNSSNCDDALREFFEEAESNTPCIVVFDDFDVLCPARASRMSEAEKKVGAKVLTFLDNVKDKKIFILGTTNKIDSIDGSFRRCGRFEREIEIPTPNPANRFDILQKLLKDVPTNVDATKLREIANSAHGFVGADLVALCTRATWHATRRNRSTVELEDFKFALTDVRPSAMREVQVEVPNVKWTDIGGQDNLKLILRQCVEWPLKHADSFIRMGITPPRGVLMFGPPGCSKTMIAKALATESGLNFLSIKGPELFSKWVGESERAVREVFRKARQVAPSIIFFDEIDALGGERSSGSSASVQERVLAQLLTELDGVTALGDVTILAATNRPDRIDKALLRPGRLDRIVYVPLPGENTRREIFRIKMAKMPVIDVPISELVEKTRGYSGAEVNAVCHEAAMAALEENLEAEQVTMKHFLKALDLIQPRTPDTLVNLYEEYVNVNK